ncbi:phosphate transporter [Methanomicrobiaceae archaeon CYW5]|uniref:inorganic phosphate transporter n=1 Tax=Methanovulcanius yangii TaxID=1789227 RepID=UPI0029CA60E6|nr:inorganic phosphate transporter [Methanovulcanius yangii]MBT8507247.1 phosphate transporter [Methanovulcanius yangii]
MLEIAILTIVIAFIFTFTNGFQDAAPIAATFITSRSAQPRQAIVFVAAMVCLGALLGGTAVAFTLSGLLTTVSGGETVQVLLIAMIVATAWNILTWKYGLPSSSTHALIGGIVGAGIAAAGIGGVYWGVTDIIFPPHELAGIVKVLVFLVLSVIIGFAGSYCLHKAAGILLRNSKRSINSRIMELNWMTAGAIGFGHGANDSQKQLGIIALALFAAGQSASVTIPDWARVVCAVLMALGTIGGGWRIMNTLGNRIFRIEPIHSFDSQVFSGASIWISTLAGAPVSSNQIISSSILGVGAAENPRKVHWFVGKDVVAAMFVTIPATALVSGFLYGIVFNLPGV